MASWFVRPIEIGQDIFNRVDVDSMERWPDEEAKGYEIVRWWRHSRHARKEKEDAKKERTNSGKGEMEKE